MQQFFFLRDLLSSCYKCYKDVKSRNTFFQLKYSFDFFQPSSRPRSPISANFPRPGNNKCDNESCVTCELLIEGTMFRSTMTGKDYRFVTSVNCSAKNVIYLVTKYLNFISCNFYSVLIVVIFSSKEFFFVIQYFFCYRILF